MKKVKTNKGDNMINFLDVQPGTYKRLGEDSCFLIERDADNNLAFVIELPKNAKFLAKTLKLAGVAITERATGLAVQFVLTLKNESDTEIFIKLCNDLQEIPVAQDVQKYADDISCRLEQWVRFLAMARAKNIPLRTQLGLIGELTFLKMLLQTAKDPKAILEKWRGPEGEAHDFILSKSAYEIKSKLSDDKTVTISNENQLEANEQEELGLIVFELAEADEGKTIVDLSAEIISIYFKDDIVAQSIFEKKLLELNFNIMETYDNLGTYDVIGMKKYSVTEEFPKLVPSSLPSGIHTVRYKLDLENISNFIVPFDGSLLTQEI